MSHHHSHGHHHASHKNLGIAFWLNFCFTIVEFIGGYFTNSMAIMSDALHDLGDSIALGMAWVFAKISLKRPTPQFSYGFKRFSLLAALINGLVLVIGSLIILAEAIPRLFAPQQANAQGMLFLAILGIAVNGLAALRLKSGKTLNEKVISWHLIEDVLGWVAVLIASVVMMFKDIPILDPILSILITLYILWNVVSNLRKTSVLFLQGVPESISIDVIRTKIAALPDVLGMHDAHLWSLDGENHILSAHIIVKKDVTSAGAVTIKHQVKALLNTFEITHATLEIEFEGEHCCPCD